MKKSILLAVLALSFSAAYALELRSNVVSPQPQCVKMGEGLYDSQAECERANKRTCSSCMEDKYNINNNSVTCYKRRPGPGARGCNGPVGEIGFTE